MTVLGSRMGALAAAIAVVAAFAGPLSAENGEKGDPRNIRTGYAIPDQGYCDQPYVVVTREGGWLCTLTTGPGKEGDRGQHVVATSSSDCGQTWSELVDIEPSSGPEASWAVPLVTPFGRIYAFYTYNGEDLHVLDGKPIRADTLGWYAYRFSDDSGRTWSDRYRLPLRVTAADRGNNWQGKVQLFWGIDKPNMVGDDVVFGFTKLGRYMLEQGEGWLFRSDNVVSERDPERLRWVLLPEGEHGIRSPEFGSVQEEHNIVPLAGGQLYCVYRTGQGAPCHAYSSDGGRSWTKPEFMTYTPGGRRIKNPRACPMLWRTENGKFLFWYHNNPGRAGGFGPFRNPVWLAGGVERDGRIHWSEPEILCYDPDANIGMSYPDLIEQDGRYWFTHTNKTIARVVEADRKLIEGLWRQGEDKTVARDGLVLEIAPKGVLPASSPLNERLDLAACGGMTVEAWLTLDDLAGGQIALDTMTPEGAGLKLGIASQGTIELTLSDGKAKAAWDCDPGVLKAGTLHHLVAIVDAGPKIISFVIDGRLCDGGEARERGWSRYEGSLGDVSGTGKVEIAPSLHGRLERVRIYNRYLRTSEAVANFHAGCSQ